MSELSVIEFVTCPGCDSPALPSSTVCGECGEHLTPPPVEVVTRYRSHDDDCSCTRCTLELYDSGRALSSVGLRGHLVRVAREVGALLNTIADDDEREQTQAEYEEALNDELYHGRGRLVPLAPVPPLGQVLPFRRLSERDFDRLITDPTKNAI